MLKIRQNTKRYFYFTKRQRGGLIILAVLLIVSIIIYFLLPVLIRNDLVFDESFRQEVENFQKSKIIQADQKELSLFPFDPNTIAGEKLSQIGLSDYQVKMILKYRDAGGKFYSKDDFSKIYSISESEYKLLEPFIIIAQTAPKANLTKAKPILTPLPFDPNTADSNLLATIGFNRKQIAQIVNYRNAGGKFGVKNDFRKIYSVSDKDFKILENYILLPSEIILAAVDSLSENEIANFELEINTADSIDFIKLKGIGPVFAGRILSYRKKLGGFYDKSQLLEVYGLDTNRYFKIANHLIVDTSQVSRFDLNNASFNEFLKHPYFEYYLVKSIFNYKEAIGEFKSVEDLRQVNMVYDQLFEKINPYLFVNAKR